MITNVKLPVVPSLNELAAQVNALAHEKGWYETRRPHHERLFLCVSELAEAGEEWRAGHALTHVYPRGAPEAPYDRQVHFEDTLPPCKPEGFPVEIADCLIRILDHAHEHGVDLDAEVQGVLEDCRADLEAMDENPDYEPEDVFLEDLELCRRELAAGNPTAFLMILSAGLAWTNSCVLEWGRGLYEPEESVADALARGLASTVVLLFALGEGAGFDLLEQSRLKHRFNATRPHRHGGKKA